MKSSLSPPLSTSILFESATNGLNYFNKYYGANCLQLNRRLHNSSIKHNKLELDLYFLTTCKVYDVFPQLLRFKLYKKSLQTTNFWTSFLSIRNQMKFGVYSHFSDCFGIKRKPFWYEFETNISSSQHECILISDCFQVVASRNFHMYEFAMRKNVTS